MIRPILKVLALVAVLLMPIGMSPALSAHAHQDVMAMGHCPDQAPDHHKSAGIAECTMACASALPAAGAPDVAPLDMPAEPPQQAATDQLRGLHPETATPPPRAS